jgi:hypothetical protein
LYRGKERQLLKSGGQTKQLEMPVTVLPNVINEQLLFVALDFKPCKRCSDCRKLLIERNDHIAASVVFLKASSFSFSLCLFRASDFFFLLMDPLDIW